MVFVDTPGMHKPKHKLGEYMVKKAEESFKEVDVVLFLTTPDIQLGRGDNYILEQLKNIDTPVILVLNKIDENTEDRVAQSLKNYSENFNFKEIIPISAIKGKNVDKLLELMIKYMPEGPRYYPEDMVTDQQERFIISEIIREKALRFLSEEVPHGIGIEIVTMKKDEKGIYKLEVNMLCEKSSHKGIIIGKNGSMLKKISQYARADIEKLLNAKVYFKIWVKVKSEWRDNNTVLKELGYK